MKHLSRIFALGIAPFAVLLLATACSSDEPVISKVFQSPPWTSNEQLSYNLIDESGALYGTCDLQTKLNTPEQGKTELEHLCGSGGPERDDRTAVVDAETLRPYTATRTISNSGKKSSTSFTSTYDEAANKVHMKSDENGKVRETDRDLPTPAEQSPDPGYYDDESLFWVVRGIPLTNGFSGAYKDVNASNGQVFTATLRVEGKENVKVPAGTFSAWKVRLETQSITQYFWVDEAAPHAIVRARIERVTYELTAAK